MVGRLVPDQYAQAFSFLSTHFSARSGSKARSSLHALPFRCVTSFLIFCFCKAMMALRRRHSSL